VPPIEKPSRDDRECEKHDDEDDEGGCTAAAIVKRRGRVERREAA